MKLQRIRIEDQTGESKGFSFFSSRGAAAAEEGRLRGQGFETERQEIEVEPNKAGILAALNRYAGHPDNG